MDSDLAVGGTIPMRVDKSREMYQRAQKVLVGGVNSPARSFRAVGGDPLFIARAKGPIIFDVDGNSYLDFVCSWGALILGHANHLVVEAIKEYSERGTSYGAPTEVEAELAELIAKAVPSIEMIRFVNSGTEATMSAIRLARGFTGRSKIMKFEGCYHGHADYLLAKAGSGLATFSLPNSAGVPEAVVKDTIILPFNDAASLQDAFRRLGGEIGAAIVEPVAGNMGVVPASKDFLMALRELTEHYGALLIFDEVITGFRVDYGGAQTQYSVNPDLTCLGKIIGGGLPVGAYGGRADVMRSLAPLGPVYQAGTLSGNPLCMAAGIATLKQLDSGLYQKLDAAAARLETGFRRASEGSRIKLATNRVESMLGMFFTGRKKVNNYTDAASTDRELYSKFFWAMLHTGVYLPPSPFETIFLSTAHEDSDVEKTVRAAEASFSKMGGC